jgi:hypothetical protein
MTTPGLDAPFILQPFQREDVDNLHANGDTGIVVAEPGAGKTLIGVQTGVESEAEVILVIAPAGVHKKEWQRTILLQDPEAVVRHIKDDRDALDDLAVGVAGWYLISPQLFTTIDKSGTWDAIRVDLAIVDEIHMLANRKSAGGKAIRKSLRADRRIAMSGTPFRNKFENAWNILRWVYPEMDGHYDIADRSFYRWVDTYCEKKRDKFAPEGFVIVGEKDPGTIAGLVPCYVQHFKRDECCEYHPEGFLADLEAPEEVTNVVDLTEEQAAMIRRMDLDYVAYLEEVREGVVAGTVEKRLLVAKLPITARARRRQMTLGVPSIRIEQQPVWERDEDDKIIYPKRQIRTEEVEIVDFAPGCASPKLDRAIERLNEEGDRPCVMLMSSQRFAVEAVRRLNELGISAVEFSGSVSEKKRLAIRDSFAAGQVRVIVAVTDAIGTGIDGLQFSCNWMLRLERTEDLSLHTQSQSRLDRRGQTEQVLDEEIVAAGSMDFGIIDRHVQRQLSLNRSLRRELSTRLARAA